MIYAAGVLVQTRSVLRFHDDTETIGVMRNTHNRHFYTFAEQMKRLYGAVLPMGSGECRICRHCSCPDAPCRHPKRKVSAMEAYGLYVHEVCEASCMDYQYHAQDRTMALISCVLFPG